MVGYPDFIMNATNLDKLFNDVGKRDEVDRDEHSLHVLIAGSQAVRTMTVMIKKLREETG